MHRAVRERRTLHVLPALRGPVDQIAQFKPAQRLWTSGGTRATTGAWSLRRRRVRACTAGATTAPIRACRHGVHLVDEPARVERKGRRRRIGNHDVLIRLGIPEVQFWLGIALNHIREPKHTRDPASVGRDLRTFDRAPLRVVVDTQDFFGTRVRGRRTLRMRTPWSEEGHDDDGRVEDTTIQQGQTEHEGTPQGMGWTKRSDRGLLHSPVGGNSK